MVAEVAALPVFADVLTAVRCVVLSYRILLYIAITGEAQLAGPNAQVQLLLRGIEGKSYEQVL